MNTPNETPIDMVLHCPSCGAQHIDRDESPSDREWSAQSAGDREMQYWTNPPHRSHLCHGCGHIWRPADVPTNGVFAIKTVGEHDSPFVKPESLRYKFECVIDHATGGKLSKSGWALATINSAIDDHVRAVTDAAVQEVHDDYCSRGRD